MISKLGQFILTRDDWTQLEYVLDLGDGYTFRLLSYRYDLICRCILFDVTVILILTGPEVKLKQTKTYIGNDMYKCISVFITKAYFFIKAY